MCNSFREDLYGAKNYVTFDNYLSTLTSYLYPYSPIIKEREKREGRRGGGGGGGESPLEKRTHGPKHIWYVNLILSNTIPKIFFK